MNTIEQRLVAIEAELIELRRYSRKEARASALQIEKLRPALEQGGLLHGGAMVQSRDLRESARAWRTLIADLTTPKDDPRNIEAENILARLGVHHVYEKGTRKFFIF